MKKILLFDVDGTIAESSQKISGEMKNTLESLRQKGYELGIVGGGRYEKIVDQLDGLELDHIFAESGCVYYQKDTLVYKKNIRNHLLYPKVNLIIKRALLYLANVDYEITGHFVDLRNGIIYLSLIGMAATLEERATFLKLDKTHEYKLKLLHILQKMAIDLGIDKELVILEGGSVGIGIYPTEWDKTQVLDSLSESEYETVHYFGDKYDPSGNDYHLLHHSRVNGHPVNRPEECLNILKNL
jgi:phosphomannomutase